ncbi:MAG: hexitol phosphatase HxpB [Bacteroidia bacterium]|nr:hexitol phosphatase HxpB [Bacteroidia bacterium]
MIKAIIFDMDGLLVDSEPYWKIAEKICFGKLGLNLNDELLRQVMGFRLSEVVEHWYNYQPWGLQNFEAVEADVLETVKQLIIENADALPGVIQTLELCKANGYKIALASSSAMSLINVVVDKLNIRHYFDLLVSAEFEPYGKPHPSVFITTANMLNVLPTECLVFEDSVNGMIAAKAARMKCIVVPETEKQHEKYWNVANHQLKTLEEFTLEMVAI